MALASIISEEGEVRVARGTAAIIRLSGILGAQSPRLGGSKLSRSLSTACERFSRFSLRDAATLASADIIPDSGLNIL